LGSGSGSRLGYRLGWVCAWVWVYGSRSGHGLGLAFGYGFFVKGIDIFKNDVIYYKKKNRGGGKMERIRNLLKGSFWKIDLARVKLSAVELDFLSNFFDISCDRFIDDLTEEEHIYLILKKKVKYLNNPYVN